MSGVNPHRSTACFAAMDYTVPPAEPLRLKGLVKLFKHALGTSSLLWCLLLTMAVLEGALAVLLIAVVAPRLSSRIGIARNRVVAGWLRRHRYGSASLRSNMLCTATSTTFWAIFRAFWTIFRALLSSSPPHTHRVQQSTSCLLIGC